MIDLRIGTAAWAVPKAVANAFPHHGSALERYASQFDAVEINSTFYRPHRTSTYRRWADAVHADFRFAVKAPKAVSHQARLHDCDTQIDAFTAEISHLGDKLGPILLQLPPSLPFDAASAERACTRLSDGGRLMIACEPRHSSWFSSQVDEWMGERRIARVAADPARHPVAGRPGGWRGLAYYRLHGSPQIYYSPYEDGVLETWANQLKADAAPTVWCLFDNTALGAATADAMRFKAAMRDASLVGPPGRSG